ncbi:hypothetical protein Pyn_22072 [Prunus yedoensis var. nudiflora]|uniref:Protein kinase domain-containing protein n=1 Tax=Prunus yedoensis var. nudiflora TaxID=2094558 RepID=A0A314XLU3_PRUYE|nr:hypothetical protein Pyn_22072 [Prunus yedoensis var. nudiflora]
MDKKVELLFVLLIGTIFLHATADPVEDKQALLDFLHNISHSNSIKWNDNSSVCKTWTGVICSKDQSRIVELHLPGAALHGPIPPNTLSRLSALQVSVSVLNLANNSLSGEIPDLNLPSLQQLDLANNNLTGNVPQSLQRFPGGPFQAFLFEGSNLAFDLEDLLRASAEVLGKGTFGTTYKAALEDATTVVVKRLKEVSVGKKEFEQQMEIVGSIRHENIAALRAYYYSKDEKLVVYDYYEQGSASSLLHAKRGEGRTPLDWETRLRIAIGAARGIAHIHTQNGGKLVHGNIKASNIFLNSQGYGCVCDIGLATLMSPMPPPAARAGGYRSPEVTDTRKSSHASDVYSFGVLILELLTGKSPIHTTGGEEVIHLVRWVNSVVREEWTAEVFDVELLRYPNIEEEMVEMLQIGMSCVARMPEQRPSMPDVVKRVEEIRQVNTGNPPSSSGISTPVLTPPPPKPR